MRGAYNRYRCRDRRSVCLSRQKTCHFRCTDSTHLRLSLARISMSRSHASMDRGFQLNSNFLRANFLRNVFIHMSLPRSLATESCVFATKRLTGPRTACLLCKVFWTLLYGCVKFKSDNLVYLNWGYKLEWPEGSSCIKQSNHFFIVMIWQWWNQNCLTLNLINSK